MRFCGKKRIAAAALVIAFVVALVSGFYLYWRQSPEQKVKALLNEYVDIKLIESYEPDHEEDWARIREDLGISESVHKKYWMQIADELVAIGPGAVVPLVEALKHHDADIRSISACALGELGDDLAVEPLVSALKDQDSDVRYMALTSLEKLRGRRSFDVFVRILEDKSEVGIVTISVPYQRSSGVHSMHEVSIPLRAIAARELGEIGDKSAVEALAVATRDNDKTVSSEAFGALGHIADDRAMELLLSDLKDKNPAIHANAANALGRTHRKEAVEPLIVALKEGNFHAAVALGHLGDRRAVTAIIGVLSHKDAWVRRDAAEALGKLGDPVAIKPLKALVEDESAVVSVTAEEAIEKLMKKE